MSRSSESLGDHKGNPGDADGDVHGDGAGKFNQDDVAPE
jgi:hypothetical protein